MEDVLTGVLTDATGTHDGTFEGEVPEDVEGPGGCGRAMVSRAASHGVIPPHEEFRLTRGAIDLWVKVADRSRRCESFLSRDASQQDLPGHFTMYAADNGHLGVRLQSSPRDAGALVIFSDAPATPETWVHVGVNFGPEGIALFIDGVRQSGDGPNGECTSTDDICTADCTTSIEGNDNPWSVGAGSTGTIEGTAMGVNAHFFGALDEVRISSTHRDFEGAGL